MVSNVNRSVILTKPPEIYIQSDKRRARIVFEDKKEAWSDKLRDSTDKSKLEIWVDFDNKDTILAFNFFEVANVEYDALIKLTKIKVINPKKFKPKYLTKD